MVYLSGKKTYIACSLAVLFGAVMVCVWVFSYAPAVKAGGPNAGPASITTPGTDTSTVSALIDQYATKINACIGGGIALFGMIVAAFRSSLARWVPLLADVQSLLAKAGLAKQANAVGSAGLKFEEFLTTTLPDPVQALKNLGLSEQDAGLVAGKYLLVRKG